MKNVTEWVSGMNIKPESGHDDSLDALAYLYEAVFKETSRKAVCK